jgi:hypothetical protein
MVKITKEGRTELLIKLIQDLEKKFLQLYEEAEVEKMPQGLWEYTFVNPLMKHFKIEDLKNVIHEATAKIIKEKLSSDNWMEQAEDEFLNSKSKFEMTSFLFQARDKYETRLIDVKNKRGELLDYKKLIIYFYPYPEQKILELPVTTSYVYEENELQAQLEIPPKGEK